MDVRKKLVELFFDAQQMVSVPYGMETEKATRCIFEQMADHLIAHGVTVQEWIPISERLPAETGRVLVRTASGYIGTETYIMGKMFSSCGGWIPVTHWMPLPEPPKGE